MLTYHEFYKSQGWKIPETTTVVARKGDDMGFFTATMVIMVAVSAIVFAAYLFG